jgi:hypothetical protein
MKTALQQVFSDLEKLHPNLFNVYTTEGKKINYFQVCFHKYLALERKQITKAFDMGEKYEHHYLKNSSPKINSDEYYNQTYKLEQ